MIDWKLTISQQRYGTETRPGTRYTTHQRRGWDSMQSKARAVWPRPRKASPKKSQGYMLLDGQEENRHEF